MDRVALLTRPSLYAQYLAERCGFSVLEAEEGFAAYSITGTTAYITDIYVIPSARRLGVASRLADKVCADAKERGCTELLGLVSLDTASVGANEMQMAVTVLANG
jgi:ribosomal protein S18 acetylase RimI-like enzyme